MDTAQREQCVITGDAQPQEGEAPGNRSEYSGCTLSDRLADPGIQDRTAEEQKDAGPDGNNEKIYREGRQDGFLVALRSNDGNSEAAPRYCCRRIS